MSTNQSNNNHGYNSYINEGADFWRFIVGVNVFPADSRNKVTYEHWNKNGWQTNPIPLAQHEFWKNEKAFEKGLMVMPGKPWHRPEKVSSYLVCIDWDKELGLKELFPGKSLDEVRREHFVEQHLDDLSRGHLWFYSPIIFPKKNSDNTLGLEIKSLGSHGVIISAPSIHKNRHPIESVGLEEPRTLTKEQAFELLLRLDLICKEHNIPFLDRNGNDGANSSLSSNLKNMIKNLTMDSTIEIHDGMRHDTLISAANSILFRHSKTKSHDKLYAFFVDINEKLCIPESLPRKEISKIWTDALEFVSMIQEQEQEQIQQEQEQKHEQVWIPSQVKEGLKSSRWAFKRYNPHMTFVVAESRLNQTVEARVCSVEKREDPHNSNSPKMKDYFLSLRDIYINAIPIEITIYEDPITVTLDQRYKIKFRTSLGKIFTSHAHSTLDTIVSELIDKALVYSAQEGKEALSRIVNAFENDGSIKISKEIETPGFFLIDGRIKAFQVDINEEHSQKDLAEAAHFMNGLVERHYRKEIPATTIKWSTVAPFDYVLKQYADDLCWIPWLGLAGWPRSGKGTQGRIACGIWGDFYCGGIKNYLPFTAINTEARLGQKLGECTFPRTFNECDALNDDKNKNILEMIKNCIETRVSRGKYETRTTYVDEPALSPCILTSNPSFPSELGFRSRIIYIVYTKSDKHWNELESRV
jgi:hypothetical protein